MKDSVKKQVADVETAARGRPFLADGKAGCDGLERAEGGLRAEADLSLIHILHQAVQAKVCVLASSK